MLEAQGLHLSTTLRWAALGLIASTLAACGGGGGDTASQGTLKLAMTDAPACGYEHVYVTVNKVMVSQSSSADPANGSSGWYELPYSKAGTQIDLLNLTNGVLEELGSVPLPAGSYEQVRLVLAPNTGAKLANSVVSGGTEYALDTPSATTSGLKLQAHFDVTGGQLADLVLDFDVCKSVVKAGNSGKYNLKPVVSVFKRLTTGIVGYVDPAMVSTGAVVSAQQNGQAVRSTVPDSTGKFTIAWLPENINYTVVVAGKGRSTAVVTGVPVALKADGSGTTLLNPDTARITPAASAMANVSGTVSNNATPSALLTTATVAATQALTGGPSIELAYQPVDAVTAGYSLNLPLAGPVKAAYAGGAALTFGAADAVAAGKYSLQSAAPGYVTQTSGLTLTGNTTKDFVLAP